MNMQSLFCKRCESLNLPGSERCRICGSKLESDSVSAQSSLTGIRSPSEDTYFDMEEYESSDDSDASERVFADSENAEAPYLPYVPRPGQIAIIEDIRGCLDSARHIVMESGTGTGKTIVSLAGALEHSIPRKKKVV